MARSNAEIFLDHYKDMEYIIREKYKLENWESTIRFLTGRREFKKYVNELQYCREVRNLLSHKPKLNNQYSVEPSDEMIHLLKTVKERLEMPPVIMDIAVPVEKILYKSFEDGVIQTLREMNDLSFGNVPILEGGVVKGVLSEKSIVHYIVQEKRFHIPDSLKLEDIKTYLLIENHQREQYAFAAKNALISDVSNLFHKALDKGARIGMVFLTQTGKDTERLLGIVTAWDLAGYDR